MTEQKQEAPKKITATERLQNLEAVAANLHLSITDIINTVNNITRDMVNVKNFLPLLVSKTDAMILALNAGEKLEQSVIDKHMQAIALDNLKKGVDAAIQAGTLVATDVITDNTFVVGKQLDKDDKLINHRMQFTMKEVAENLRAKFLGAKPGDILQVAEGGGKFHVLEVYNLVDKNPDEPAQEPAKA
jgi:hypothetical protein